ncbi:hypothetical protein [Bradyrhizobium sp. STM 3557]|uniref:hypothetical protein n=1 Tax=Bradyrhizobium sp. STM 3557 TaxID=578920 RepID=UPI003890656B
MIGGRCGADNDPYLGGCRPGLSAHLSAFSLTSSWLGRFGGFESFGIFGSSILFSMSQSPWPKGYACQDDRKMNNPLNLLMFITHLANSSTLPELRTLTQS